MKTSVLNPIDSAQIVSILAEIARLLGPKEITVIIFYGKVTYFDVFGTAHWTTFCTGTGTAIQTIDLKKCVNYNDVDTN